MRAVNLVTLAVVASGTRPGSYVGNVATEQEWLLEAAAKPGFAAELAARSGETNAAARGRDDDPFRSPWARIAAGLLAHCGINPRAVEFRLRRGFARGDYIGHLRAVRGLAALDTDPGTGAAVRAELVRRSCRVELGATIDFRAGAGGARHLLAGWSICDNTGVWNDGSPAQLLFDLGAPPAGDVTIELVGEAFTPAGERVVDVAVGEHNLATWRISAGLVPCKFVVPRDAVAGSLIPVTLSFPDLESPRSLGLSDDPRLVAVRLVSGRVIDGSTH
jgi:hypothetical protein